MVKRTFQRTIYRPAELIQCDLWEPSEHIPVGYGQTRRGWVVTTQSCWSRAFAGTLIFGKEAPDILAGLARSLSRLGVRAEKLVWDRESAIAAPAASRPSRSCPSAASWRSAGSSSMPAMRRRRGSWSAQHRFLETNFEPRRFFANHLDFQDQLDRWAEKVNGRVHRTIRASRPSGWPRSGQLRPLGRVSARHRPALGDEGSPAAADQGGSQRLLDRPASSPGAASRSGSHSARSPRPSLTRASSPPGTRGSSRAPRRSSTRPTRASSRRQRQRRRQRHQIDVEQRPLSVYDALIA